MQGLHLTADLHGCRCAPEWLLDAAALGRFCVSAVHAAGLQPVGQLFHQFPASAQGPGGVTATVLLAESHLCVHTWPERSAVTLDVYVCNFGADHSAKAHALMDALLARFEPAAVQQHALQRGGPLPEGTGASGAETRTGMKTAIETGPPGHLGISPGSPQQVPALVLAAGRGERMRPLTDTTPKPLLAVRGQPLLQWHLQALQDAGVSRAVINTAWLGEQISERFSSVFGLQRLSDKRKQLSISYSHEGMDFGGALETAGGIARALPQLAPLFWLAAGDVFAPDFVFDAAAVQAFENSNSLAHLWLVPNPAHNPRGDFGLSAEGLALNLPADDPAPRYTYSTIALLRAELFAAPWCDIPAGNPAGVKAPLAPLLRRAMDAGRVSASLYTGRWTDVGTPERLAELNR